MANENLTYTRARSIEHLSTATQKNAVTITEISELAAENGKLSGTSVREGLGNSSQADIHILRLCRAPPHQPFPSIYSENPSLWHLYPEKVEKIYSHLISTPSNTTPPAASINCGRKRGLDGTQHAPG